MPRRSIRSAPRGAFFRCRSRRTVTSPLASACCDTVPLIGDRKARGGCGVVTAATGTVARRAATTVSRRDAPILFLSGPSRYQPSEEQRYDDDRQQAGEPSVSRPGSEAEPRDDGKHDDDERTDADSREPGGPRIAARAERVDECDRPRRRMRASARSARRVRRYEREAGSSRRARAEGRRRPLRGRARPGR